MASMTIQSVDQNAHQEAMRMSDSELAVALRDALGAKLVAYLAGVGETRTVRGWAEGSRAIGAQLIRDRLVVAFRALRLVTVRDTDRVAQAWFLGMNPALDDEAPAKVIRDSDDNGGDARRNVLQAARRFAAVG